MIAIKIILFILIMALWKLGGTNKKAWCRDILIPVIMGTYIGFVTVWWIGILSVGSFQIIRIGYGIPDATDEGSFLGRLFKMPWLVRGMAGLCYGLIGGINVFLFIQQFYFYILYVGINFAVNAISEKMKWHVNIVEPLAGAGVASLIWMI